jgi:colicin import membrane protein
MNPFLKEHATPLVGSALLHVILLAGAIFIAVWTVAPKLTPPAAIEAYVAARPSPHPTPPPAAPAAPVEQPPAAPPAPPQPDPRLAEEAAARARHVEQLRIAEHNREVDAIARHAAEAAAARETQRKAAAAAEAERKVEEARHRAEAAAAAKRKAEAAQLAASESDLTRQLAAEEHRTGAEHAGLLQQYITEIQARIERAWNRPPTAKPGLSCTVYVSQVPGGTVTSVRLGVCNGDSAVQQSITLAVYRASPLPPPPDPSLFERNLRLIFEPQ